MNNNILEHKIIKKIQNDTNNDTILKKLMIEYPTDDIFEFNEFTVGDKLQNNSFIQEHFRTIYISESSKLYKLENMYEKERGVKYNQYKYNDPRNLTKTEIEKYYLPTDKKLEEIKRLINIQKVKVQYFEALVESIKAQSYNMNTFVKNLSIGG